MTFSSLGFTSANSTNYIDFADVKLTSNAVYAGNGANNSKDYIQLRSSNSNSGIITTTSGGILKSITIEFNSATATARTVDVYGKNIAYSAASELYSSSANTQGTLIGSAAFSTTAVTVEPKEGEEYQYIGFRSKSGALYINKITIVWDVASSVGKTETTLTFGEDNDNKTFELSVGEAFSAPTATLTPTEAGSIVYSSNNENVAKVDVATGVVTLGETAGIAKITASFVGNDTYAASSASYIIKLTKPFVIEDGVFDFADGNEAYGSGLTPKDNTGYGNNYDESTKWEAGSVKMETTGRTRWFVSNGKNDFRIYNGATITISVPEDCIVTNIDVTTTKGSLDWNGLKTAQVTASPTSTVQITKIAVSYEKAPVLSDVTLHVGPTGYATLYYSDRALTVPENTEAYTYSAEFGNGLEESERYKEGEVIPADEAVVVFALEEGDYTFKVATESTATKDDTNMLKGTDEETEIADDATLNFYKLSLNDAGDANSVGFYWGAEDGRAFKNGAHKSYLTVTKENANGVKAFAFNGTLTGINTPKAFVEKSKAVIYNLAGQRVSESYKGLVIKDGKKYVVK